MHVSKLANFHTHKVATVEPNLQKKNTSIKIINMKVWKAWPERCKMFSVWLPVHTHKVTKLKPLEKLNRKFKKFKDFYRRKSLQI